jgi:putative SOS response-associated peptidase YedK
MCFFVKSDYEVKKIEHRYKAKFDTVQKYTEQHMINGFSFPEMPVITNNKPELIQHFYWGLIPQWAKDHSIRKYTLNAKIETLDEKPSFKNVLHNRCLVIANGFYEWHWNDPKGKLKQKYLITLPNNELFSFGGIWSERTDTNSGETLRSFSIVTTEANELMSRIHNSKKRMPVILSKNTEYDWLSGTSFEEFGNIDIELNALKTE